MFYLHNHEVCGWYRQSLPGWIHYIVQRLPVVVAGNRQKLHSYPAVAPVISAYLRFLSDGYSHLHKFFQQCPAHFQSQNHDGRQQPNQPTVDTNLPNHPESAFLQSASDWCQNDFQLPTDLPMYTYLFLQPIPEVHALIQSGYDLPNKHW